MPKSYLTQRQAIPWPCQAHGSSQKGSPEDGGGRSGEGGEGGEKEEEEKERRIRKKRRF